MMWQTWRDYEFCEYYWVRLFQIPDMDGQHWRWRRLCLYWRCCIVCLILDTLSIFWCESLYWLLVLVLLRWMKSLIIWLKTRCCIWECYNIFRLRSCEFQLTYNIKKSHELFDCDWCRLFRCMLLWRRHCLFITSLTIHLWSQFIGESFHIWFYNDESPKIWSDTERLGCISFLWRLQKFSCTISGIVLMMWLWEYWHWCLCDDCWSLSHRYIRKNMVEIWRVN